MDRGAVEVEQDLRKTHPFGGGFFITRNVSEEIGSLHPPRRDGRKRVEDMLLKTLKVAMEFAETESGRCNDGLER